MINLGCKVMPVNCETDEPEYLELVLKGQDLPKNEVEALEVQLQANSLNIDARFQLLGYYSDKQYRNPLAAKKLASITFWLIDNMPDCGVIEHWGAIDKIIDEEIYDEFKRRWLCQVKNHRDNAEIISAAAGCLSLHDPVLAEKLYRQAILVDPLEPDWSRNLARLLSLSGPDRAIDALDAMREALRKELDPIRQYYLLTNLAQFAFDASDFELAANAAVQCLSLVSTFGDDWNHGNAIHNANSVLGRIALRQGDLEAAKHHLVLAGATPGSPQLDSFGPDMDLAAELFASGERDCVIAYLKDCRKFWDKGVVKKLIRQVETGKSPQFNLR
jgi:hypothetical protein